jgi:flagellar hook assembly protein FlgD
MVVSFLSGGDVMKSLGKQASDSGYSASSGGRLSEKKQLPLVQGEKASDAYPQIEFSLQEPGHTTLNIYKINGQLVRTLLYKNLAAGRHLIRWDGRDEKGEQAPCGVYFCLLEHGGRSQTGRMLLV